MIRRPNRSENDQSFMRSAEMDGTSTWCRAHQWTVESGTPESAAARSAGYAPRCAIGLNGIRRPFGAHLGAGKDNGTR
jgi:hypothetical protein